MSEYRELQAKAKKLGLKAHGKAEDIKKRIADFVAEVSDEPLTVEETAPVTKATGKGFVFVGAQVTTHTKWKSPEIVQQIPDNPPTITIKGYTFVRDGEPVEVDDALAAKLRTNSHFKEV